MLPHESSEGTARQLYHMDRSIVDPRMPTSEASPAPPPVTANQPGVRVRPGEQEEEDPGACRAAPCTQYHTHVTAMGRNMRSPTGSRTMAV